MLIPILALAWLTSELWAKDRRLRVQQAQERIEYATDHIVAQSHQRLADLGSELGRLAAGTETTAPAHTVFVVAEGDALKVVPAGGLIFRPVVPRTPQPHGAFAEGERYEHQQDDARKAIEWFRATALNGPAPVRAGALLRLGRNQRNAEQFTAALDTYAELEQLSDADVDGLPAAMLALSARCSTLEQMGDTAKLASTAQTLRSRLTSGTWPVTRDVLDFYIGEANRWTGAASVADDEQNARAVAAAFQGMYERWKTDGLSPTSRLLIAEGRPVLATGIVQGGRLLALVAGVSFLQDAWKDVAGVRVFLADGEGRPLLGSIPDRSLPQTVRTADVSKLPWSLRVASEGAADSDYAQLRRWLLLAGLATVLSLFVGSAYFTLRGFSRELAVARLQSDFVSAVSHEFRTPLASIRHLSEMLSKGRISDEVQRQQSYDYLSRESERLERLVEDLLDFGRIEGGAYRYRFERLDAAVLMTTVAAEFQEKVGQRHHRIDVSVPAKPVMLEADRAALSRAIWNLLDNAVKYSPGADAIWIALTVEDRSVAIRVRDRGLGIALEEQQQIFQKFARGSNARDAQIKGTGIGLAMVRHIADAHRGEVRVDSQLNHGSTFSLLLPLDRPGEARESPRVAAPAGGGGVPAGGQ